MSRFLYLIAGLLLTFVLNSMSNADEIVSNLDVKLKVVCQTKDSLRVSLTYVNKTPKRIVLQGFVDFDFDNGGPRYHIENKCVDDIGNIADTIKLTLPSMKNELQYQRMNDGDTLDVFSCLRSMAMVVLVNYDEKQSPPTPPNSWKELCSESFIDKDLFNVVWNDSTSFPHETFLDSDVMCLCRDVIIEPFACKEVIIDMGYLLKRKATYILQVDGFAALNEAQAKNLDKLSAQYGFATYKGRLLSNRLTIVSE